MFPRLLELGRLSIPTHGALVAIGLVCALLLAAYTAPQLGLNADRLSNLGFLAIVSFILGSRIVLLLTHWHDFADYPALLLAVSVRAPAVLIPGVVIALVACLVYLRVTGMPALRALDALAAPIALGHAIACFGAFAGGADFGTPTTLPWAVTFHSRYAALWSGTPQGLPLHPVQLYECGIELLLCALLLFILRRAYIRQGEMIGMWLFLFGIARFLLEFVRGDRGLELFGGYLDLAQLFALGMIAAAGALWMRRTERTASPETTPYAL